MELSLLLVSADLFWSSDLLQTEKTQNTDTSFYHFSVLTPFIRFIILKVQTGRLPTGTTALQQWLDSTRHATAKQILNPLSFSSKRPGNNQAWIKLFSEFDNISVSRSGLYTVVSMHSAHDDDVINVSQYRLETHSCWEMFVNKTTVRRREIHNPTSKQKKGQLSRCNGLSLDRIKRN